MQSIIDHARSFPEKIADLREEFAELAKGQQPRALFIACSDSRVMPSMFTGSRPGEIFELRTAGNIVPRYRPQAACGVAGTLEYAVTALGVPDIVVCGHSHCGAVKGLMQPQAVRTMPQVERWLAGAGYRAGAGGGPLPPQDRIDGPEDPDEVTRQHLLTQLEHLRTYPCVERRLASGQLRLHAWFYTVETGQILALQPGSQEFQPL